MTQTLSIQQASANLIELVHAFGPGDEIVLTDNDRPVARIVPRIWPANRTPGAWIGKLEVIDDSEEVILDHFRDYLP